MAKTMITIFSAQIGGIEYYFNLCSRLDPSEIVVLAYPLSMESLILSRSIKFSYGFLAAVSALLRQ